MAVKMRLRRMGAKHQPSYRIVVADSRSQRDGRYIDQVGFYNPLPNPAIIRVDRAKAIDWLRKGAEPTETVTILLGKFDIDPRAVRKGSGLSVSPTNGGEETRTIDGGELPPEDIGL
ncbi:MAG: 30S ribosomal protein S16 [Chloroflexi bacterium]|nr:30S ribosomal protein S16 [Chloroflexota bacterium]